MGIDKLQVNQTRIALVLGDITDQNTDAIVNAANPGLMGGGGVDGAIHRGGGLGILLECKEIINRIGRLDPGKAVITSGGNLKAKYVIHAVGPIWRGGMFKESDMLAATYKECLKLANERKLRSISFPSISTGTYRYPMVNAANIALSSVIGFLEQNQSSLVEVDFVLFDSITYNVYSETLALLQNRFK
jgi:O-acetyl-ADP-ribose deacetylase (regulator of RNase III)